MRIYTACGTARGSDNHQCKVARLEPRLKSWRQGHEVMIVGGKGLASEQVSSSHDALGTNALD